MRQFLQKLADRRAAQLRTPRRTGLRYDLAEIRALAITENVADLIAQKIEPARSARATHRVVRRRHRQSLRSRRCSRAWRSARRSARANAAGGRAARKPAGRPPTTARPGSSRSSTTACNRLPTRWSRPPRAPPSISPSAAPLLAAAGEDAPGPLFEIVNHMNQGIALIDSRTERLRLAKLNLLAATRARNSTAYDLATRTCRSAIELLGWDAWEENYALAFEAHLRLAECQALLADFEGAFASHRQRPAACARHGRPRSIVDGTHTHISEHGRHDRRGGLRPPGGPALRTRPAGATRARARRPAAGNGRHHQLDPRARASRACSICHRCRTRTAWC